MRPRVECPTCRTPRRASHLLGALEPSVVIGDHTAPPAARRPGDDPTCPGTGRVIVL